MKLSKITALILGGSLAFVVGCGGGGGSSSSASASSDTTKTGTFIDAPVANLAYETSSGITGVTDSEGHYRYNPGDSVVFKLGNMILNKPIPASDVLTPIDLADNNNTVATNLALIFQNLDTDGNPNDGVIKLPDPKYIKSIVKDINISDDNNVTASLNIIKEKIEKELKIDLPDVNKTEAAKNLEKNVKDYAITVEYGIGKYALINKDFWFKADENIIHIGFGKIYAILDITNKNKKISVPYEINDGKLVLKFSEVKESLEDLGVNEDLTFKVKDKKGNILILQDVDDPTDVIVFVPNKDFLSAVDKAVKLHKYLKENNLTAINYDVFNKSFADEYTYDGKRVNELDFIDNLGRGKYVTYNDKNVVEKGHYQIIPLPDNLYLVKNDKKIISVLAVTSQLFSNDVESVSVNENNEIEKDILIAFDTNIFNVTVNSGDDVKKLFDKTNIIPLSNDDINGSWSVYGDGQTLYYLGFDQNGKVTYAEPLNNISKTADYSIDDNGIVEIDAPDMKYYIVNIGPINNGFDVYFLSVNNDGKVTGVVERALEKAEGIPPTIEEFKKAIENANYSIQSYDLTNKTLTRYDNEDHFFMIDYYTNNELKHSEYNEENLSLIDQFNFTNLKKDNVYVAEYNDGAIAGYLAVVGTNGDEVDTVEYNEDDSEIILDINKYLVLKGDATNTQITSDNVKDFFENSSFIDITSDDVNGTWKDNEDNVTITFNDDGTFSVDDSDGNEINSGSYSVNNSIIVMDDNVSKSLVLPVEQNGNDLKTYIIFTTEDGYLRGGRILTLTKE